MKDVLHVWNIGSGSSVSLKSINNEGWSGDVVMRGGKCDPFNFTVFYGGEIVSEDVNFMPYVKDKAINYRVIHLHGIWQYTKQFRVMYPEKVIIIHYHGSDLLDCKNEALRIKQESYADAVLVSTEDMIPYVDYVKDKPCYYVPNPIDTDIYKPIKNVSKKDRAVMFTMNYLALDEVKAYIKEHCKWNYDVKDREDEPIEFYDIPKFYSNYTKYIDIKICKREKTGGEVGPALSKSGLEALACGLTVFNWENKELNGLPKEHTMKEHAKQIINIYNELLCAE